MRNLKAILLILFSHVIGLGQDKNIIEWGTLEKSGNIIESGISITFPTTGEVTINNSQSLKEVKSVQILYENGYVLLRDKKARETKEVKSKLINNQFIITFGNTPPKNFEIKNTESKKTEGNSTNNGEKVIISTTYYNALHLYEASLNKDNCLVDNTLKNLGLSDEQVQKNIYLNKLERNNCNKEIKSLSVTNIFSYIGGLDVTKYADGLAKFLVKRTKEELTISFFENFKDDLNQLDDLKVLFPKTNISLQRIVEIYDYNRYLTLLRESYYEDFLYLPHNINILISEKNGIDPNIKLAIQLSSKIIEGIQTKQHPGNILSSIDISGLQKNDQNLKQSIIFTQVLSEALRDNGSTNNEQYWIEKSKILKLTQNEVLFKIFFGLLIEDERIKNDTDMYKTLNDINNIEKYMPLLVRLSDVTQGISSLIKNQKTEDNFSAETVSKYIAYSLELVKISNEGYNILYPGQGKNNNFTTIISILEKSNAIFNEIYTKKYSSAIFSLIDLLNTTFPQGTKEKDLKWLMKYGTFMASCIEAENSDEIAKIIETYALPSGSSRVKRNSYCNIALNSYLGIYGTCKDNKFVSGITAPVGITVSHGSKSFGSISLFLSAIDIGAISAFRFTNDSSQIAKIYLKEILSPGVFLSYGIPKTPISINGGFQSAPLLSRVNTTQNDVKINYQTRWSVSILVDIPLLNIYNKTAKPKCKEE